MKEFGIEDVFEEREIPKKRLEIKAKPLEKGIVIGRVMKFGDKVIIETDNGVYSADYRKNREWYEKTIAKYVPCIIMVKNQKLLL